MLENTQLLFTVTSISSIIILAIYILLLVNELRDHWNKKIGIYINAISLLPFTLLMFIQEPSQLAVMLAYIIIYIVTNILMRRILKRN